MKVTWIECLGNYSKYINLFIGDECIALVTDPGTVAFVKDKLDYKNTNEEVTSIDNDSEDNEPGIPGFSRAYYCDFCGCPDDETCNC